LKNVQLKSYTLENLNHRLDYGTGSHVRAKNHKPTCEFETERLFKAHIKNPLTLHNSPESQPISRKEFELRPTVAYSSELRKLLYKPAKKVTEATNIEVKPLLLDMVSD